MVVGGWRCPAAHVNGKEMVMDETAMVVAGVPSLAPPAASAAPSPSGRDADGHTHD